MEKKKKHIEKNVYINSDKWVQHFSSSLFKVDKESLSTFGFNQAKIRNGNINVLLNSPITNEEIMYGIRKLKNGKAHGRDGIGAEFYKNTCLSILPLLLTLFNKILHSGNFPDMWSESLIIPLYKFGSKNEPSNYRGISL